MAERKTIHVEPDSEIATLLKEAEERPITLGSDGVMCRVERERKLTLEDYDPAKAPVGLRAAAGSLAGIDIEAFKQEIREQRTQNSSGRPAE